jgi:hypothetical protein
MGILALPMLLPESSETFGSSQFERLGLLVSSNGKGVMEAGFGFSLIV